MDELPTVKSPVEILSFGAWHPTKVHAVREDKDGKYFETDVVEIPGRGRHSFVRRPADRDRTWRPVSQNL